MFTHLSGTQSMVQLRSASRKSQNTVTETMPITARQLHHVIGKRSAPRGTFLPISAFVIIFIFTLVQLQSDTSTSSRGNELLTLHVGRQERRDPSPERNKSPTTTVDPKSATGGATTGIILATETIDSGKSGVGTKPSLQSAATGDSEIYDARQKYDKKCTEKRVSEKTENINKGIQETLTNILKPPSGARKLENKDPVRPCKNTFIDLGANIGDSMGKLIDAGFPRECPNVGRWKTQARYNMTTGIMEFGPTNELIDFARRSMAVVDRHPEDYCYVGVEGNPAFTERLRELEAKVMDTTPRPLLAVHFYTETVGAGEDGPTFLYLDTVNAEQNFWGSSIISTHKDAKRSAAENGNVTVKAPVMGLTLSTLLNRSVQRVNGSHVIIKIDIEGGEYPVINAAINTLCDFTSAGVRIDLMMETHSQRVTGQVSPDQKKYFSETQHKIPKCNIHTGNLAGLSQ